MKIKAALAASIAFAIAGAALAQQWDWGDAKDEISSGTEYARSQALCRALRDREPPASDRPDAAARRALRDCDSEALYYGIGMRADPVRARQCAFIEAQNDDGQAIFAGRTMLMTIYANGVGAARDLDVAIHLACGIEGAPAESEGRVSHLAELKAERRNGRDFDYCDDITSGYAMGNCAAHQASVQKPRREAALAALTRSWTTREQSGFRALRQAHEAYVDAHGSNEVDLSGTARAAIAIGEEEALRDELVEMVRLLSQGRAPSSTAAQHKAADAKLNAAYAKARREATGEGAGAPTREGIQTAERAWLRYRDAFIAFARLKFPRQSSDSIATWLTLKRTERLSGEE
jgi:uncharacterized protein YecT (DUF1311 family)